MSVLIDINRHTIFGPIHRDGLRQGREEGIQEGREEGRLDGARTLALRLLAHRFGAVPPSAARRVRAMNSEEIDTLSARLFEVGSVKELLS